MLRDGYRITLKNILKMAHTSLMEGNSTVRVWGEARMSFRIPERNGGGTGRKGGQLAEAYVWDWNSESVCINIHHKLMRFVFV